MISINYKHIILIMFSLIWNHVTFAGGIPFTSDDLDFENAINSDGVLLDVLSNDDSGINNDDFKEVIALCDINTSDQDCIGNTFSDAIGSVSINGAGDSNNVLFSSNVTVNGVFDFKYIMQNSSLTTGSGFAKVTLPYFEVNELSDNGTMGCSAEECTLREAIFAAELDNVPNTIRFNRDLQGTILLNGSLLIDDVSLNIVGPGVQNIIISGNGQHRVFYIASNAESIQLSGLTISNGLTSGDGGGIIIDGSRNVLLENIRIINNQSTANGGGVYFSFGSGTIRNSEISGNDATLKAGGLGITGSFGSDVTIDNVTISGNTSDDEGAGFYVDAGNGQNVTFRYITSAFNSTGDQQVASNKVESGGNFNIESSIIVSNGFDLLFDATNNIINNTIVGNYSGVAIIGGNNLTETGVALSPLAALNDTGLKVHEIEPNGLAHNYVNDTFGKVGCGTVIPTDQIGTQRPVDTSCDAGAYEYIFIDLIFNDGFE